MPSQSRCLHFILTDAYLELVQFKGGYTRYENWVIDCPVFPKDSKQVEAEDRNVWEFLYDKSFFVSYHAQSFVLFSRTKKVHLKLKMFVLFTYSKKSWICPYGNFRLESLNWLKVVYTLYKNWRTVPRTVYFLQIFLVRTRLWTDWHFNSTVKAELHPIF